MSGGGGINHVLGEVLIHALGVGVGNDVSNVRGGGGGGVVCYKSCPGGGGGGVCQWYDMSCGNYKSYPGCNVLRHTAVLRDVV